MSNEKKVGLFALGTIVLLVVLANLIGIENPFRRTLSIYVTYNFAGGVEEGSAVRVSGIKVGKVERIEFFVPKDGIDASKNIGLKEPGSAPDTMDDLAIAPVRLKLSIAKEAAPAVREDSRFYINLAGIIGERYIEITPGHRSRPELKSGATVPGVDPPRIDQLISQSFDLAGKVTKLLEENKGDLTKTIENLYKLSANLNKTLAWVDQSGAFKTDLSKLINNLIAITSDVKTLTAKTNTPEGKKLLQVLYDSLLRLEKLDEPAIRQFLQKEGIRAKIF